MNIRKQILLAGMAALPLFFTACCTSESEPSKLTEEQQKNIIVDEELQDKLKFEFVRVWSSENGLTNLAVRARVKTYCMMDWIFDSYKNLNIAYRFAWFNKDGVEVLPKECKEPVWSYVIAGYGEELGFGAMSPSVELKTYKLFIRVATHEEISKALNVCNCGKAQEEAETAEDGKAPTTAKDVKTPPSSVTPIKQEVKTAPAVKSEPAVPAKKVATTAKDVKVPPTSVTPIKKDVKKSQAAEEAEADAASLRQAKPNKK